MSVALGRELLRLSTMADYLDTEIEVIGYDPVNSKSISSKKAIKSSESLTSVLTPAQQQFFIDPDADSEEKAKVRAGSISERMKLKSCFAEGELIGIPEIVPGRFLKVEDVDDMVDKSFYLSEVTHYWTEASFRTSFEARGWT